MLVGIDVHGPLPGGKDPLQIRGMTEETQHRRADIAAADVMGLIILRHQTHIPPDLIRKHMQLSSQEQRRETVVAHGRKREGGGGRRDQRRNTLVDQRCPRDVLSERAQRIIDPLGLADRAGGVVHADRLFRIQCPIVRPGRIAVDVVKEVILRHIGGCTILHDIAEPVLRIIQDGGHHRITAGDEAQIGRNVLHLPGHVDQDVTPRRKAHGAKLGRRPADQCGKLPVGGLPGSVHVHDGDLITPGIKHCRHLFQYIHPCCFVHSSAASSRSSMKTRFAGPYFSG